MSAFDEKTTSFISRHRGLLQLIAYLLVAGAVVFSNARVYSVAHRADDLVVRIDKESKARVDESCTRTESQYIRQVQSLESTYTYILQLSPAERKTTLNKTIINGLSKQEVDARTAKPPTFCLAPGVGLEGNPPDVPKRPDGI